MNGYAVVLKSGSEDLATAAHGFQIGRDLDRRGNRASIYLCGSAVKLPGELSRRRAHPMSEIYSEVEDRGLVAGACLLCVRAHGAAEDCEHAGIELLGSGEEHAPDAGLLAEEELQILTV